MTIDFTDHTKHQEERRSRAHKLAVELQKGLKESLESEGKNIEDLSHLEVANAVIAIMSGVAETIFEQIRRLDRNFL